MSRFTDRQQVLFVLLVMIGVPIGSVWLWFLWLLLINSWIGAVWAVFLLSMTIAPVITMRNSRRRKAHQAIAARADYEHHALARGDLKTWMYGQFQPPEDLT
jgi:hypothetical protein